MLAGTLVYLPWEHSDDGRSKNRPGLVLEGPDEQGDLLLLKVTGQSRYPNAIKIEQSDLTQGELRKTSYVRPDRFSTVHHSTVELREARLKTAKLAEIRKAI